MRDPLGREGAGEAEGVVEGEAGHVEENPGALAPRPRVDAATLVPAPGKAPSQGGRKQRRATLPELSLNS